MTEEGWRNRSKWEQYVAAAEEMFKRTDTKHAPWTIVPANNKRYARIKAMQTVATALRRGAELKGIECPKCAATPVD